MHPGPTLTEHFCLIFSRFSLLTRKTKTPKGSEEVYAGRVQALNNYLFSSGIVYRNPEGTTHPATTDTHVYGFFGDNGKFIPIFQVDILTRTSFHAVIRHINPNEI